MPALIAFRALQGLGAGAVQPMAGTIAGDIYTIAERARVQGYLASVWAISAVVGPTLGGFFSQFLSWRWIFYVNVPLCILAAWMLLRTFHETVEHREHKVDYLGATLLTVSLSLLRLLMLAAFAFAPNIIVVALCCLVVGLGLGLVSAPGLIVAAAIAMPRQRAVPDTAERE